MKIDYALLSCDDNSTFYSDFWPIVMPFWNRLKIKPILFYVNDIWHGIDKKKEYTCVGIPKIKDVPSSLQGQIARIWALKKMELDKVCIISDIDQILYSVKQFQLDKYKPYDTLILGSDYHPFIYRYPMSYIVMNTRIARRLIVESTWEEFAKMMLERNEKFNTDELYITELLKSKAKEIKRQNKEGTRFTGLVDRNNFSFINVNQALASGGLIDVGFPRPYGFYKEEIDKVCQLLLNSKQ